MRNAVKHHIIGRGIHEARYGYVSGCARWSQLNYVIQLLPVIDANDKAIEVPRRRAPRQGEVIRVCIGYNYGAQPGLGF